MRSLLYPVIFLSLLMMTFAGCTDEPEEDEHTRELEDVEVEVPSEEVDDLPSEEPDESEVIIEEDEHVLQEENPQPKTTPAEPPKKTPTTTPAPPKQEQQTKTPPTTTTEPDIAEEPVAPAEPKPEAPVQSPYKIKSITATVTGTSSLHDWEMKVNDVNWKGTFVTSGNDIQSVKDVQVTIPVKSMKSTEGGVMDKKTYEAFKSDKNPNIIYKFNSANVNMSGSNFTVEPNGTLTMAGSSRPVTLNAKGTMMPNGDIRVQFSQKLDMTQFGMETPTAMLGAIKVGKDVTVNFDLVLTK